MSPINGAATYKRRSRHAMRCDRHRIIMFALKLYESTSYVVRASSTVHLYSVQLYTTQCTMQQCSFAVQLMRDCACACACAESKKARAEVKRTVSEVARLRKKTKRSGKQAVASASAASAADRELGAQLEAATGVRSH